MLKTSYNRNLPHIQPIGATFFVTARLAGTLPKSVIETLKQDYKEKIETIKETKPPNWQRLCYEEGKRYFKKMDDYLDKTISNIRYLEDPVIANIVIEQLQRFNSKWYDLLAYSIMPNHIHIVIDLSIQIDPLALEEDLLTIEYKQLTPILKRIKGASARYANLQLKRTGQAFWQEESYDHYIRKEKEFGNIINYTLQNPVKAGLVEKWEDHAFTWCKA